MKTLKHMTSFEVAAGAGIFALVSDEFWLLHDILTNGLSIWYILVGIGLLVGIIVTGYAWYHHHKHVIKKRMRRAEKRKQEAIYT